MKMPHHKNCPMCKQEIFSDARIEKSCLLCGMIIDKNFIMSLNDGEEQFFCSHDCYIKNSEIIEK